MAVQSRVSVSDPLDRAQICDRYADFYAERAAARQRPVAALEQLAYAAGSMSGLAEELEGDRASLVVACMACADAITSLGAQELVVAEATRALALALREDLDAAGAAEAESDEAHDHHRALAGDVMQTLTRVRSLAAAVGLDAGDVVFVLGAED